MDWLNKARQFVGNILGGAGRTISNIAGGVARNVGQAEQQAARVAQQAVQNVQRNIPQAPRFQLPQVRIQTPQIQLPQAPKIDFAAVGKALSDYYGKTALSQTTPQNFQKAVSQTDVSNIDKLLKSYSPTYQKLTTEAPNTAKGFALALQGAAKIMSGGKVTQEEVNKINEYEAKGFFPSLQIGKKTSIQQFGSDILRTGVPIGVEAGSLLTGTKLAGLSTPAKLFQLGKAGLVGGGAYTGQDILTGQGNLQQRLQRAPQTFAQNAALSAGGELVGYGASKVLGKVGQLLGNKAQTAVGKTLTKTTQALPTDKNALVIVGSLPEKGALRAQGYTNVKVQFQPKPGQVAPTMQGAIPQVAPKAPKGQEAIYTEARKFTNATDFVNSKLPNTSILDPRKAELRTLWEKANADVIAQKQATLAERRIVREQASQNALLRQQQVEANKNILNDLNPTGNILTEYTPQARIKAKLGPDMTTIDKTLGGSPNDTITIYRGAPKSQKQINPGDFVTTNRELAKSYTGDGNVLELKVKKGDLLDSKSQPGLGEETLYRPNAHKEISKPTLPVKPIYETAPKPAVTPKGVEAPKSSVQTVIDALAEAKPIRGKQEALYSAERAKRVARVAAMGEKVQGEKGYFAQLGQLKGALPKVQFEGIRKQITQPVVDDLFNQIEKSNISVFEKVTAKQGLAKLLGAEGGVVPTRGELSLLNEVFPKELTQAILAKRTVMQKLGSIGGEIINLPRSIMSTVDLSAPLRQGVFLIGKPKQFIPAFASMLKYAGSEKAYQGLQAQLRSRPTYQLMRQSRLALTDINAPLTGREEAFMSNLAEKIPVFGHLAKASDRAYTGFLNKLRADVFDDLLAKAKATGVYADRPQVADDIAKFVNSATGRGKLAQPLERSAVALNAVFFSPRLMASRINLLNPAYYIKLDPFVRKEALKSLFTFAATGASILGLAKAGGADVGVDPRSADFGKIKIGNTRYDPWGGFQQYMVLASRLLTGEMISSTTGKQIKLGDTFKTPTRLDIIQSFLESKQAPIASFVTGFLKGKTATGENFNLPVEIADRFMPMMTQDMYDLYKEYGSKGIAMGIPGIFGAGSQTYQDQIPVKTKTKSGKETITWRQAPSLGETLINKITGKQVTNVPQEQIPSLQEARKKEIQYGIDLDKVKAEVLASGETKTIHNPVRNVDIQVYLKDGIVTTKDIKAPIAKKPKVKVSKARRTGGRGRVARAKVTIPKAPRLKAIKVAVPKAPKVSFKQPTPTKARKSIKIKTG